MLNPSADAFCDQNEIKKKFKKTDKKLLVCETMKCLTCQSNKL